MKVISQFQHGDIQAFRFGYAPFGKPNMYVHVYFIDGLLIDTGQPKMREEIFSMISDLPVKQIFITHYHEDHTGNIEKLANHFKCPVYSSVECAEIMKRPPPISFAQKMVWGDRPAYKELIPINEAISTPHFQFQLIPIPGHAHDMLALYEPNKKWLFSADLYVNTRISYYLKGENMKQQIASTKKILELEFDALLCAHRPQLNAGKEKLQKKLVFLEDYYEKVLTLHQAGKSPQQIMKELHLKESWPIRLLSGGDLSQLQMVKSVTDYV